ncbi:MAG TPA: hypothetical protein VMS31_10890 [Pyrinomonadaceae bacterium]|nr:hypothetical protein [Pyrinomonadaceae bacterium]
MSSNVRVTSVRDEASKKEVFNVTVSETTKPGHYLGKMDLVLADKPTEKLLSIDLDVTSRGAPSVDSDVSSKSLTLKLGESWWDLPYLGQPAPLPGPSPASSPAANTVVAEFDIYLIQSGGQPAIIQSAEFLGMRGTAGVDLPAGVVRVSTGFPLTINGNGTAGLKIQAGGYDLPAGEYNGTLQINVAEQTAPVKIPIKALIKNGPLLAFIVLVSGLLAAFLFGWWNSKGKAARDLITLIQQLEVDISDGEKLQIGERNQAIALLKKTVDGIEAKESAAEVQKKFDAAQAYVAETRAAAQAFITDKVEPLLTKTAGIAPGKTIREGFVRKLEAVKKNIIAGKYQLLDDAKQLIEKPLNGIVKQVAVFEAVVNEFSKVEAEKQVDAATKMDAATTLVELRKALTDAGLTLPGPAPGVSFAIGGEPELAGGSSSRLQLSTKTQLQLTLGSAIVSIIFFLFALAVGWISIYVKSDTFGANPMEYITLFLWGATAEAIRGQTITLTNLKTIVKETPGEAG